ncbi:MAG: FtsW/RodA/SpoVE family cell cycle protein [Propionibacteriaceae bacterium]|jgi:cell division protein FtsW (lipid II flippase)|nr:FtsW/RodA/SpoVE family cell cycle protein [Propionibacteriaceae bacterium]
MAVDAIPAPGCRPRRNTELVLILVAQTVGLSAYLLTHLFRDNALPPAWLPVAAVWYGLGVATSLVVRWRAPYADPVLLPTVFALLGLGLSELHRLSLGLTELNLQFHYIAAVLGLVCFAAVVIILRDPRRLQVYPYFLSLVSFVLLLLPLVPGLGVEVNGSRIWINLFGFSLQPAEIAKLVLAASFAAYLTEQRDLLAQGGRKFLGVHLTRVRDIGPILLMWAVSLVIMVYEKDLGTSMLFFGLFTVMLYVATNQFRWLVCAAGLAVAGGLAAWRLFPHVRRRFVYWLDPFSVPDDATQILSAQYGLASGGLLGTGWGLGRPGLTPFSFNDMISTSLGEEIGIVGLMGIIVLYALLAFRGLACALRARDGFTKLFATGLSFGFLLQVFAIVGGATRLLPLTGLTSPFLSQGGSSLVANWLLVALLVVISHEVRRPHPTAKTDLAEEETMVMSARRLRQVAVGPVGPLLAVAPGQTPQPADREGPDGEDVPTAPIFPAADPPSRPPERQTATPAGQPPGQSSAPAYEQPFNQPVEQPPLTPSGQPLAPSGEPLPTPPADLPSAPLAGQPSTRLTGQPIAQPTDQPPGLPSDRTADPASPEAAR